MNVIGVVLGAGSSRRLGRPKQTLPIGDDTVLGRAVAVAAGSRLHRVILVVGGAADEALAGLEPSRAEVAYNEAYRSGCASSLLAGLDTAGACDGIVLLLGDMPTIDVEVIDQIVEHADRSRPWAAAASYRGTIGHPFYFSAASFPDLRALHGDKAVWKIIDREPPDRVHRVAIDRPLPPDIDTWDDYRAVLTILGLDPPLVAE